MEQKKLEGKTAIVTGGGQGIGRATAVELAREGARVVIAEIDPDRARRVAEEICGLGSLAVPVQTDVKDETSVQNMVQKTLESFGTVHILVNNAGAYPRKPWEEMTVSDWDFIQDTNLKSCYLCSKAVFSEMKRNRYGKIVNVSSVTFLLGLPARLIHYIAAKGGVIGFTRALAREAGEWGIYVNAVSPGAIKTEEEYKFVTPKDEENFINLQSLKRRLLPVDVAKVILFLAGDDSNAMSGQTLNVDGGWYML